MVDDEYYEKINEYKWYAAKARNTFYAARHDRVSRKTIWMHRIILNPMYGVYTDHVNRNGLDNRSCNLRQSKRSQNMANTIIRPNVSSYRGVTSNGKKWQARVRIDGERYHLGNYATKIEAALAYDYIAAHAWGEFAQLNFTILR